jgi:hypothetical protein
MGAWPYRSHATDRKIYAFTDQVTAIHVHGLLRPIAVGTICRLAHYEAGKNTYNSLQ